LASSFSQVEAKKNKGKNHREEIFCREQKELTFKLLLCLLTFGSCFCLFVSSAFSLASFSSQAKEKKEKHKERKTIDKKQNAEKGGSLPFFSHFFN
jgi:hypothetical protein